MKLNLYIFLLLILTGCLESPTINTLEDFETDSDTLVSEIENISKTPKVITDSTKCSIFISEYDEIYVNGVVILHTDLHDSLYNYRQRYSESILNQTISSTNEFGPDVFGCWVMVIDNDPQSHINHLDFVLNQIEIVNKELSENYSSEIFNLQLTELDSLQLKKIESIVEIGKFNLYQPVMY